MKMGEPEEEGESRRKRKSGEEKSSVKRMERRRGIQSAKGGG